MISVCTHLMFQGSKAQAAVDLYGSVFPAFKVISMETYGPGDPTPGLIRTAKIDLYGHILMIIDSPVPHRFDFTPSMSLFVDFDQISDLERAFSRLTDGGEVKMPLGNYGQPAIWMAHRSLWCLLAA